MDCRQTEELAWSAVHALKIYCEWFTFCGVPIFVEGLIHEFQYPRISDLMYEIMKENTMATNFEPHKCVNFVQSTKIGTCTNENKAIHSTWWDI